ncbi:hypothetical protein RRG08_006525 [Elysia crispata]|uniref:Pinin n=1 Tax=Elysia crispata TaxID=231223 RepID=A0AAE0YB23_9GAST|nr:hypothetical protein RRG08_006525 [Elysia crispata]
MAELRGVDVLQNEIEKSKDKLKGFNENIKKLTGRDPNRPGVRRILSSERLCEEDGFQNRMARGRGRLFGLARRSIMDDSGPPLKRRIIGGAFSRLGPMPVRAMEQDDSPYEEELPHKLSVHSSVVATSRDAKNRDEIMQEQTKDKEGMQRNRRMFGLLLGTLNRFKKESKTLETKDVRRKKIEEKLEEKAEKERKKFKQETKLLMEEMHLEQSKISRLEQKMEMVQEHADREAEIMKLKNFVVTKAKPKIFWKPVQMSTAAENKIKDSKKFVEDLLQEGKDRLDKEILELMERETKREERIKMRLREDGLLPDEDRKQEGIDRDIIKDGTLERVVVETKDVAENVTFRFDQWASKENENEILEGIEAEGSKKLRTVVVDTESRQVSEVERKLKKIKGNNQEKDRDADDIEFESLLQQKGNKSEKLELSEEYIDEPDRDDYNGEKRSQQKGTEERKRSPADKIERKIGGEKKEQDVDRLRYKKDKKQASSMNTLFSERIEKKDKYRNQDRTNERNEEIEKRKYRYDSRRESSSWNHRERPQKEGQDEKRDQVKEKKRKNRKDSSSDDYGRPVRIKQEHEEENADCLLKKTNRISGSGDDGANDDYDDDDDDDDDVVVKDERIFPKRSEKAENASKAIKNLEDGKPETYDKQIGLEESSSVLEN